MARVNYSSAFAITALTIILMLVSSSAFARPVSYPDGWTVMQKNNPDVNSLHVHYSPTAKYSVGYKAEYWREEEWQGHYVKLNYLGKRWNMPKSQANFYVKSGLGVAYSDFDQFDSQTEPAAFTGIALDWEDRRYFTAYENRVTYAGDIAEEFRQSAKVGIAPYIGDYGDLHTWLMFHVEHTPKEEGDEITYMPMVRFFKDVYLVELGITDDGEGMANFIVRF